ARRSSAAGRRARPSRSSPRARPPPLGGLPVERPRSRRAGAASTAADMAEVCVRINEFTDPGCPWAYSAEPFRRRLNWLYEGSIEWIPRMVVLADAASDYAERGYTPDWVADSSRRISREHGMPIDTRVKPRAAGTRDACQAVVAARRNATEFQTRRLLRALR